MLCNSNIFNNQDILYFRYAELFINGERIRPVKEW